MARQVFVSHSSRDDGTVAAIRRALESCGVAVWDDARKLVGGSQLEPEIRSALEGSDAVVAVLSPRTINSRWVTKEIEQALAIQQQRGAAYPVIPVMLDGIEPAALDHWFPEEPVGLKLEVGPGGIQRALPGLLDALGLSLPVAEAAARQIEALPVADLTLELTDPRLDRTAGTLRGAATAELVYSPAGTGRRQVRSRRFQLVAPLGPIEADDLRWYLERYASWPSAVFQERARRVEASLPEWGRALHAAALGHEQAREVYEAWRRDGKGVARRLTVLVDRDLVAGAAKAPGETTASRQEEADEAATLLLALPWELLHDAAGYLFHGPQPVRVRRRLPNRVATEPLVASAPLRVLLVSPRPEDEYSSYLDHRSSARPVVEALSTLGDLAELEVLSPPTFERLQEEVLAADRRGAPYHVVHFDGHGVYLRQKGLGALCFERGEDVERLERRRSHLVDAAELAAVMRDRRIPLFFLDACQTAKAEDDPTASVAAKLLQGGVGSVVAMSHVVLVPTTRLFVGDFYRELLAGQRIGDAMVAGQRKLKSETFRRQTFEGPLSLDDWFVPVLYQEEEDPQLIHEVPAERMREVLEAQRRLSLGDLPGKPDHGFVGRSRELLAAERLLERHPYVVLRGEGGEGKTTLAAELARWLVGTRRFGRAAFVSLEQHGDARAVQLALGGQLVLNYTAIEAQGPERAWLELQRALRERRTLVVLDNLESILPAGPGSEAEGAFEPEVMEKVLQLARKLATVGDTRLVLTTRQPLPDPLSEHHVTIGRLGRQEAIDLVARVLGSGQEAPNADDAGDSENEITNLVDAVGCHARSLVLLAREVAATGVRNATERLAVLMARLQESHPDDRERSLFASVELSLRRLAPAAREAVNALAAFRGGIHLSTMASVLREVEDPQAIHALAEAIVDAGLGEPLPYGYLRLDPALGPLLLSRMDEAERQRATDEWALHVRDFVRLLHQGDVRAEALGVVPLLDLPNILGALEHLEKTQPAEVVVDAATSVELLLQSLGRPRALARASRVRERAARRIGEWNHARFQAEDAAVDRLLDAGRFNEGVAAARRVLATALRAGEGAYTGAEYDLAMAHFSLGRALEQSGDGENALPALREARLRFERLGATGVPAAARMASVAITDGADCLVRLGRIEEGVAEYLEAIRRAEQLGDQTHVAVNKAQLGSARFRQGIYDEALAAFHEARVTFQDLNALEPLAKAWHQLGLTYQELGDLDDAERSFQSSLQIKVRINDRSGEATTLAALSTLYSRSGRLEEAVRLGRRAGQVHQELGNPIAEGRVAHNLANTLLGLDRPEEAKREMSRAIELLEPFGHSAEPWKAFSGLMRIEQALGHDVAAREARERAIETFMAYRRSGGENRVGAASMYAGAAQAIVSGSALDMVASLAELSARPDLPRYVRTMLPKLDAILRGSRDARLADDPDLDFDDAAELRLLLEFLADVERQPGPPGAAGGGPAG